MDLAQFLDLDIHLPYMYVHNICLVYIREEDLYTYACMHACSCVRACVFTWHFAIAIAIAIAISGPPFRPEIDPSFPCPFPPRLSRRAGCAPRTLRVPYHSHGVSRYRPMNHVGTSLTNPTQLSPIPTRSEANTQRTLTSTPTPAYTNKPTGKTNLKKKKKQ